MSAYSVIKKHDLQIKDTTEVCGTCVYYNGDMNDEYGFCDKKECEVHRDFRCERWQYGEE